MLTFDSKTGVAVSDVEDVRAQVRETWQQAFAADGKPQLDVDPETPAGQLIDSQTAAICEKDNELLFLANQFNPRYAEGKWQDALCNIYFITRHPATPSQATLTCTGLAGTVIPAGAQVRDDEDRNWECTQSTRIGTNSIAQVPFSCLTSGPVEAKAGTIKNIVTSTPGWSTAINEQDAIIGNYEETQAALEARRYQSVALNSRSSEQSAYSRIASLDGVVSCCIRQNRTSEKQVIDGVELRPHSVYTCVLGGSDDEIAEALYNTISAGCDYTGDVEKIVIDPITHVSSVVRFARPTTVPIGIKVSIRKNTDTPPNAEVAIKEAIYNNFYGLSAEYINNQPLLRVVGGNTVYASRFYISLLNQGFSEILSVELALPYSAGDEEGVGAVGEFSNSITVPINVNPSLLEENIIVSIEEESDADSDSGSASDSSGDSGGEVVLTNISSRVLRNHGI